MPRWFKITLWLLAGLLVIAGALYAYAIYSLRNVDWNIPVYKEYNAQTALMADLTDGTCLTRDMVISNAQNLGWVVQDADSLGQCSDPDGVSNWLTVTTEDGLMLPEHPSNITYFGFDVQGCAVYLPALAGLDGNCPAP